MASKATNIEFLLSQVRNSIGSMALGSVTVYSAGTSNKVTIWQDRDKQTEAANPYDLDVNGTAQIYADGLIKVVIKNAAGTTVYTRDYLNYVDYLTSGAFQAIDADYASLNAAITAIGSIPTTLLIRGADFPVTETVAVPGTLALKVEYPGTIDQSTYAVVINGPFSAPLTQVFAGSGTVTGLARPMPEWWGAVTYNNGITVGAVDSSAAIQAAIYSMSTDGDQYHSPEFAEGRYRCDSTIMLPEGVSIVGRGMYKTNFQFENATANAVGFQIDMTGSAYGFPPVIKDIGIGTASNGIGIETGRMSGLDINHVWFSGVDGVSVSGDADTFIDHCVFETIRGIVFTASLQDNNYIITNNLFSGCDDPITIKSVSDVLIHSNDFRETRGADIRFVTGGETIQRISILGNHFYNGVGVGGVGQVNVLLAGVSSNIKIANNTFEGANAHSISSSGTLTDIEIYDNTFRRVATDAIHFNGAADHLKITGNTFDTFIGGKAIYIQGAGPEINQVNGNFIKAANDNLAAGDAGAAVYINNIAYTSFLNNIVTATNATKGCYISAPNITFIGNYHPANYWNTDSSLITEQMGNGNRTEYRIAMPTTGTWKVGDRVINTNPVSLAYINQWLRITTGSDNVWDVDWKEK